MEARYQSRNGSLSNTDFSMDFFTSNRRSYLYFLLLRPGSVPPLRRRRALLLQEGLGEGTHTLSFPRNGNLYVCAQGGVTLLATLMPYSPMCNVRLAPGSNDTVVGIDGALCDSFNALSARCKGGRVLKKSVRRTSPAFPDSTSCPPSSSPPTALGARRTPRGGGTGWCGS